MRWKVRGFVQGVFPGNAEEEAGFLTLDATNEYLDKVCSCFLDVVFFVVITRTTCDRVSPVVVFSVVVVLAQH